jgi:hypothetical protein
MAQAQENRWRFITDPLRGKIPVSRVIWLYGIVGSLVYGVIGLLFDVTDERGMRIYTIGGLIFTVYVTVATYQCAVSVRSTFLRRLVRVSAVLTLLLLPVLTYFSLFGVLELTGLRGEE